jgi:hypothetical protein
MRGSNLARFSDFQKYGKSNKEKLVLKMKQDVLVQCFDGFAFQI